VERGGWTQVVHLPADKYPILLNFPLFAVPRLLSGETGTGIAMFGMATVLFGPDPHEVMQQLGAQKIVLSSHRDQPGAFARMVAKIGYAYAVATGKADLLDGPSPLLPAILGQRDDIGDWVGTHTGPVQRCPGQLHRIWAEEDPERGLLMGAVHLFADSEAPSYGMILGRLRS
jgi:hypothetical protein